MKVFKMCVYQPPPCFPPPDGCTALLRHMGGCNQTLMKCTSQLGKSQMSRAGTMKNCSLGILTSHQYQASISTKCGLKVCLIWNAVHFYGGFVCVHACWFLTDYVTFQFVPSQICCLWPVHFDWRQHQKSWQEHSREGSLAKSEKNPSWICKKKWMWDPKHKHKLITNKACAYWTVFILLCRSSCSVGCTCTAAPIAHTTRIACIPRLMGPIKLHLAFLISIRMINVHQKGWNTRSA